MHPLGPRRLVVLEKAILVLGLILPSLITWLYFVGLARSSSTSQQVAYAIGKAVQFGLPVAWMAGVIRERLFLYPFQRRAWLAGLLTGLASGMLVFVAYQLSVVPSSLHAELSAAVREKIAGLNLLTTSRFLGLSLFYSLFHSFLEEYYWRWFIFGRLRHHLATPIAMVVSSFGFMAHHVIVLGHLFGWDEPLAYGCSLGVAGGGMIWSWLYERCGGLGPSWLSHLLVDAAIFGIGYGIVATGLH